MAAINLHERWINVKIVYYGPGLSGKTTNLIDIHRRMPAAARGALQSIETDAERTLFFDFIPVEPVHIGGWDLRFHLYSVPGQEHYQRTRRAILGGADGIVFVADAAAERLAANEASVVELRDHLAYYGHTLDDLPVVFQFNKTDLPSALGSEALNRTLNERDLPWVEAIATRGNGVAETLRAVSKLVAQRL